MTKQRVTRLTLIAAAFALTLSLLALRDRLDAPQRLAVEPAPAFVVIAGS
jgi:hypothetical protein